MGLQLEFYMTHDDEHHFIAGLMSLGDLVVYRHFSPTRIPALLELTEPLTSLSLIDVDVVLMNRDIDPRLVILKAHDQRFFIDEAKSDAIQFTRCFTDDDQILHSGRVWYEKTNASGKPKKQDFLRWADTAFRLLTGTYTASAEFPGRLFGADASRLCAKGLLIPSA